MSNKRRRLDADVEAPPLSAFAARSQRVNGKQAKSGVRSLPNDNVQEGWDIPTPKRSEGPEFSETTSQVGVSNEGLDLQHETRVLDPTSNGLSIEVEPQESDTEYAHNYSSYLSRHYLQSFGSSIQSRDSFPLAPPARSPVLLSTVKPSAISLKNIGSSGENIRIAPGERLTVIGQYELRIEKGQISILGCNLRASKTNYRIFAPASHALPVIRCPASELDEALIQLLPLQSGIELLKPLSPLFSGLWNNDHPMGLHCTPLDVQKSESTYKILHTSHDVPTKAYVQPILVPPKWNEILARLTSSDRPKSPVVFVCGPKNAGKSTFAKLLGNRLLSVAADNLTNFKGKSQRSPGFALLDLDPGQPEYSAPGQLSLNFVEEPSFSPPFVHPVTIGKSQTLRAHATGALTPAADPNHYVTCALDLFEHYRGFLSMNPECPLIINTPGWILGTGLELLQELITKMCPTEVVYMSREGPLEVVQSLQEASGSLPFYTLPSRGSEYATRTSAQLRTMQHLSYFHLSQMNDKVAWDDQPLTSIRPLEIRYAGGDPGILGIMCYGEQPPPELLADTINGSLLAIVVIDDMAAIQGWNATHKDADNANNISGHQQPPFMTTPEALPYLHALNTPLNPAHSHTLGLLLVRGIDVPRRRLQVLTPIPTRTFEEILEAKKSIILISGKLDTPGWAYLEGLKRLLCGQERPEGDQSGGTDSSENGDSQDGVKEDKAEENGGVTTPRYLSGERPWVERLSGSQGRASGAKVWRVRRDLGKRRVDS